MDATIRTHSATLDSTAAAAAAAVCFPGLVMRRRWCGLGRAGPSTFALMGRGPARPKYRMMGRVPARPINVSEDGPRPGLAHHLFKQFTVRPCPIHHIFKRLGPARPITWQRGP